MLKFVGIILPLYIYTFSSVGLALVEEQPRNGLGTQLSKLKDQCQSVGDKLGCYELGIDLILGLTTEEIVLPEDAAPVIQNTEVFDETAEPRFSFSGDINGFDFKYSFHSISDLRYTCFSENLGVPENISNFSLELFIDGNWRSTVNQSSSLNNKYKICEKFLDIAMDTNEVPVNHLSGTVITGNFYSEGLYFPYLIRYSTIEQFERECLEQFQQYNYYPTSGFSLAIHTEVQTSDWIRYSSSNGGKWNSYHGVCGAIKTTVEDLMPTHLH